jgi:hypothetical protein
MVVFSCKRLRLGQTDPTHCTLPSAIGQQGMFNSVRFLTGECIANEAKKSPAAKKTPEACHAKLSILYGVDESPAENTNDSLISGGNRGSTTKWIAKPISTGSMRIENARFRLPRQRDPIARTN